VDKDYLTASRLTTKKSAALDELLGEAKLLVVVA